MNLTEDGRGVTVSGMESQENGPWRPADTLANRLLVMRHQLRLSQREAASRSGISFGEWQSMENGAAARSIDVKVAKIAEAFRVDRDWLMWGQALGNNYPVTTDGYLTDSDRVDEEDRRRNDRRLCRRVPSQNVPTYDLIGA